MLGLLASPIPTGKPGTYPAWWFSRDAIARLNPANSSPVWPTDYPASDDYSGINQGQLKNFATQAYNELQAQAPSSVWSTTQGTALTTMVTGWNPASGDAYAAVNLGQLKTVAKPFYDVLMQLGYANAYPWTGVGADDYAGANIGQVKNIFGFDVGFDTNGILYSWEYQYFGQIGIDPTADPNGDGISNYTSYILGLNPVAPSPSSIDTDGDGVPDYLDYYPSDPTRWLNLTNNPSDHTPPTIQLDVPSYATPLP